MRIKRGRAHIKHRKSILKWTKGYRWGRKSKIKLAKTAMFKAGVNAYRDRRNKKRAAKATWHIRINAAARPLGATYSVLKNKLTKANIKLDQKSLATLAKDYPAIFAKIVEKVK